MKEHEDAKAFPPPGKAGRCRPLLAFAIAVAVLLSTSYYGFLMSATEMANASGALTPLLLLDNPKPCSTTTNSPPPSSSRTSPTAAGAHSSKYASIPRVPVHKTTKTVLVTGGAGFIGSHVADALLARGDTVIVVDELNNYYDVALKLSNIDYLFNKHSPSTELQTSTPDARVSDRLFFSSRATARILPSSTQCSTALSIRSTTFATSPRALESAPQLPTRSSTFTATCSPRRNCSSTPYSTISRTLSLRRRPPFTAAAPRHYSQRTSLSTSPSPRTPRRRRTTQSSR